MLERNLSCLQCPVTRCRASELEVFERRVINGVEHIYSGAVMFDTSGYPIRDGIVCFGSHPNAELYDQMFGGDFVAQQRGEMPYGVSRREKLLASLGNRALGWLEQKTFLDAGSGLGRFTHAAVELGADVIALDSSFVGLMNSMARLAEQCSPSQFARCDFVQADILQRVFVPRTFDVVYSSYALHHTEDTRQAIATLGEYVKPGGHLAVRVHRAGDRPPQMWILRQIFMELPREKRMRCLAKLGVLRMEGVTTVIDLPELAKIMSKDPDLAPITNILKQVHRENMCTDYTWEQTQEELARWFSESGLFVEYQMGDNIVGRFGEPGMLEKGATRLLNLGKKIFRNLTSKP